MNYYERHLGDYARDTGHLSQAEHGAYNLLMDRYYATELGISNEKIYRVGKANTKAERKVVDFVLAEFFTLKDGVWIKGRIEQELEKVQVKIKIAQENGKKGGRPKTNPEETETKPSGLFLGSKTETQKKAHQSPVTSNQIKQAAAKHSPATPPVDNFHAAAAPPTADADAETNRITDLTVMLRKRGAALQDDDPNVRLWVAAGITDAQALTALDTAQQRRAEAHSSQPISSSYLDTIITNPGTMAPEPKKARSPPWWTSNELMEAKAKELKIAPPKPGESWEMFRGRINAKLAEVESAGA